MTTGHDAHAAHDHVHGPDRHALHEGHYDEH
jgi:hypothetical protein